MKRLFALLLCIAMLLSGCGTEANPQIGEPDVTTTEATTTTEETTTEATTVTTTEATTTATEPEWVIEPCNEVRYATADLNVRETPKQDGKRISHIDKGDEVTVTGWVDNGWARIKFRDGEYFINGKYLATEKPVVTTAATTATTTVAASSAIPDAETLVKEMGIGWNLGNTLDCVGDWINKSDTKNFETAWGHPVTTEEMIVKIKELGFNTIRIPVSWGEKTDKNFNIDEAWMDRVQEIVDYAYNNGMYVIINSHHDNYFYLPSVENEQSAKKFISKVWGQIAERFKGYDYHLIFESMNEPRLEGTDVEWWYNENDTRCKEAARILNELNQLFVDTVRSKGGYNKDRYLTVTPYCASPDTSTHNDFKLPTDSVKNRLIVSAHAYTPYNLVMGNDSKYVTFGSQQKKEIDNTMKKLYDKFVSKGIPVYIGETGCINKNNPDARYDWAYYFVSKAHECGIPVIVWENSGDGEGTESYGLFNRRTLEIFQVSKPVYNGLMDAVADFK